MTGIGETKPLAKSIFPTATPPQIKTISINGVHLISELLRTELIRFVSRSISPSPGCIAAVFRLRDWLLSNEGQKVVAESGYVIWK